MLEKSDDDTMGSFDEHHHGFESFEELFERIPAERYYDRDEAIAGVPSRQGTRRLAFHSTLRHRSTACNVPHVHNVIEACHKLEDML